MGFSRERLGHKLGMSFQQVQKYENGTNSLSARRLYQMSQVMAVPITFFFDGYADMHPDGSQAAGPDKLNLALVRACLQIESPMVKLAFIRLIKTMAKTSPKEK